MTMFGASNGLRSQLMAAAPQEVHTLELHRPHGGQ